MSWGVDLISNRQLNLDAGTHFNYWRGKIGKPNIEGLGYFLGGWRLVVGRKRSRTELVISASRASLLLHPNNSIDAKDIYKYIVTIFEK